MIKITHLSHGKLSHIKLEQLHKNSGETWIDCINPSKQEIKLLSEKTGIPKEDISRSLDEDERPNISDFEDYSIITYHAPYLNKAHNYTTVPFSIIIKGQIIVIVRTKAIESVEKLENLDDKKKIDILQKDVTFTIFMLLNEVINHFFRIMDELEISIDKIEQNVLQTTSKRIVKQIFALKKTLIYFYKSLTGNREVITGIEKRFVKEIKGPNIRKFRYLYNDVIQLIDMTATLRDILSNSLDIYLTSVSNNLNEVVKRLTVITAFVLIPTLISGIYGMNFKYMPEIHIFGRYGYPFAISLMVVSTFLVYLYFRRKAWI